MRRLQKKRLVNTIDSIMRKALNKRNFVGVNFATVRKAALQSRIAYSKGTHIEIVTSPETQEFISEYLPKILEHYWGLESNEYAIYVRVGLPTQEHTVSIVFHPL